MRAWNKIFVFVSLAIFYLSGLAPGVTFEDSGEFAMAAVSKGIAHPPGYPLYIWLTSHLITLFPHFEPVWIMNVFSALTMAGSASICLLAMEAWEPRLKAGRYAVLSTLTVVLVWVSAHIYRQAVITEVYGLHSVLVWAVLYFLFSFSEARRSRDLMFSFFFLGLALSNHHLSLVLAPVVAWMCWREKVPLRTLMVGLMFLFLGLAPYVLLPIHADADFAWGTPKTAREFWFHVLRGQYLPHLDRPTSLAIEQLREQAILLTQQLSPFLIFAGFLGLWSLFEKKNSRAVPLLMLLLLTGPITALMVNFNLPLMLPLLYEDIQALQSVFFITHYQLWIPAILFGFLGLPDRRAVWGMGIGLVILLIIRIPQTVNEESKSSHRLATSLYQNWITETRGEPALILVNWDPFSFPAMYQERVLGQEKNILVLDIEMWKSHWYPLHLLKWHPQFFAPFRERIVAYSEHVKHQIVEGGAGTLETLYREYIGLLTDIRNHARQGGGVYLALSRDFAPAPIELLRGYRVEPLFSLGQLKLEQDPSAAVRVPLNEIDYNGFERTQLPYDRVDRMLLRYYVRLLLDVIEEKKGEDVESYWDHAFTLAKRDPELTKSLRERRTQN